MIRRAMIPALLVTSMVQASPLVCADVFEMHDSPVGLSAPAKNLLERLDSKLNGTYQFLSEIRAIEGDVQAFVRHYESLSPAQQATERRMLLRALHSNPRFTGLFDSLARSSPPYAPTEREIQYHGLREVLPLLKKLPRDLRPRIDRVQDDPRMQRLNVDARALMSRMEGDFLNVFKKTEGHQTPEEIAVLIRGSAEPMVKKAVEIIDQEKLEIVMRRPENGRFWIPRVGFQNQFVTGTSKGMLSPEWRNIAEANLTNTAKEDYAKFDNELKPKYATLRSRDDAKVDQGSAQYGDDFYIFDLAKIQDRLSFTLRDSLNLGAQPKETWQHRFIPWKHRILMAPFAQTTLRLRNMFFPARQEAKFLSTELGGSTYWETQIFGRLDLSMVKTFEFGAQPPSAEFAAQLRRHGIEIRDARTFPSKPWTEDLK